MKTGKLTKIHQQFRVGVSRYDRERADLLRRAQAGDAEAVAALQRRFKVVLLPPVRVP